MLRILKIGWICVWASTEEIPKWLDSYIRDKCHFLSVIGTENGVVENIKSKLYKSNGGVPQGFVLGSILFNVYVNDIYEAIQTVNFTIMRTLRLYLHNKVFLFQIALASMLKCTNKNLSCDIYIQKCGKNHCLSNCF